MKILIVDDNKAAAEMMSDVFSAKGLDSSFITDPKEAVSAVKKLKPDVVLLDIMMPGIDGITVCKNIKADAEASGARVIMLTAKDFVEDKEKAKAVGAEGFINKTLLPDEVLKIIYSIVAPPKAAPAYIKFWGTSGSIATTEPETAKYGGDTACVEANFGDRMIIFDAGTGLRRLGDRIIGDKTRVKSIDMFLSHYHWDHIQGLPFFIPAYSQKHNISIYGCSETDLSIEEILETQMSFPYFPIPFKFVSPNIKLRSLAEETIELGDIKIKTTYLNHPGNALGFRIEYNGKAVVYMPDNEINFSVPEYGNRIVDFCKDADILIHDAQYTPEEYKLKKSWGHSTQEDALKLAIKANVKKFFMFHHDPSRTDAHMEEILAKCRKILSASGSSVVCEAARQGEKIEI